MTPKKELHEENRLSWNAATVAHNSHKGDQAAWLRAGGDSLFPEELELLGPLEGIDLVHLQCNAGQDSLCLARRGARVTGVDISDEAIGFARRLSAESGIGAEFGRADVYDWLEEAGRGERRSDVVFSSYGAVCWLSDLEAWARGIARVLRPGGRFVLVEFHPTAMMFDNQMRLTHSYFAGSDGPVTWDDGVDDYVAASGEGLLHGGECREGIVGFRNPHRCHEFPWGIGQIVTALIGAGLLLETLREYPYSNGYLLFEGMRPEGRRYRMPEGMPDVPLMFALAARKGGEV